MKILIVLWAMLSFCSLGFAGENLLQNPGMEEFKGDEVFPLGQNLKNIYVNWSYPAKVLVIKDKEIAHTGETCLRVEPDPEGRMHGEDRKVIEAGIAFGGTKVKSGEEYILKAWAKGMGTFQFLMYESGTLESGAPFTGGKSSDTFEGDEEWKEYKYTYKYSPPEDNSMPRDSINITFAIHSHKDSIFYIDDVSLMRVEEEKAKD